MLHTSFRSAGIPLCIVCEYCRKNRDFRISNIEYETGRVWRPIAQLVLNRFGYRFRYLLENNCCTRASGQRVFRLVSSVSIVEKTAIFEYRISNGTRLANHSSAGSQPIRMRFSLFVRQKMLHTSFRSAGIPLCIVCEYCRKNSDFRISNIEYETGRVWRPIAQLVLNRSGCGFRYLAEKKCCTRVSGQRVFRYVSSVSIVEKTAIFEYRISNGTRLATHSSAGSQPIRMRFSLFGREKMLHTSFRSAGIPLCIVCEYCRKNSDFRISNIERDAFGDP